MGAHDKMKMKTIPAFFFAMTAVLLLASCSSSSQAVADDFEAKYTHSPLTAREAAKLQRAFRRCATLELEVCYGYTTPSSTWRCVLRRGQGLEEVLARLRAVPEWFAERQVAGMPGSYIFVEDRTIRFRDAQGRLLYESLPYHPHCYRSAEGDFRIMDSLLPFPVFR